MDEKNLSTIGDFQVDFLLQLFDGHSFPCRFRLLSFQTPIRGYSDPRRKPICTNFTQKECATIQLTNFFQIVLAIFT
jgi:hypothetical protein